MVVGCRVWFVVDRGANLGRASFNCELKDDDGKPFVFDTQVGKTVHARVGTTLYVTKVEVVGLERKKEQLSPVAMPRPMTLTNPMERTLSDLVGSAVVFDLQQLLENYLPVVGTEGRNQLIETIRQEANEYLDQELMGSPSKSSLRARIEQLGV